MSRRVYLDVIRIVSCILVVCIHTSATDYNNVPVSSLDWQILNGINCIGINGVPMFFMLSGVLMLNEAYELNFRKLFSKIVKLLLAYYITLIFYNALPFVWGWVPLEPAVIKEDFIEAVIYGEGVYHLWFIPVLAVLYMLMPILKNAFGSKKICEYYLSIFVVLGIIVPTILLFDIPGALRRFLSYYQEQAGLYMVTGYIGYFVLGHYIHSFCSEINKKRVLVVWGFTIVASAFTILTCFWDAQRQGSASSLTNTPFSINVLVSCVGIFLLLRQYGERIKTEKVAERLHHISGYTLGIYLFHPFVINLFSAWWQEYGFVDSVLAMLVIRTVVVLVFTVFIVHVLKKVPGIKGIL